MSWERIARAWEAAQGSDDAIRAFRNTILGETWFETGEAPDWRRLYDRERWPAGFVPAGGLLLTAGADVQKDRIEVDVWACGRGLESWHVDHIVIDGGPESEAAWAALAGMLGRTWPHALGAELQMPEGSRRILFGDIIPLVTADEAASRTRLESYARLARQLVGTRRVRGLSSLIARAWAIKLDSEANH